MIQSSLFTSPSSSILVIFFFIIVALLETTTTTPISAQVNLPAMVCNLCSSIKICSCGKFWSGGVFGKCEDCSDGYACGGANRYECQPGSFGRGRECAVDRFPEENYGFCSLCPANSYQNSKKQKTCIPCPANTQFNGKAATSVGQCTPCADGFSSSPGQSCKRCGFGEYVSSSGCRKCPDGYYYPLQGARDVSFCTPCGKGKVSASDRVTCTDCSSGSYQPDDNGTKCLACEPGSFNSQPGMDRCLPCDYGSYVGTPSATECSPSPLGYHNPAQGATSPVPCGLGRFSSVQGLANCSIAQPGEYVDSQTASYPEICGPGTFQNETGASSCRQCPLGTANDGTGKALCPPCVPGTFSDQFSLRTCKLCRAGSAMSVTLHGSVTVMDCIQAPKGSYVNSDGATQPFLECPVGTASNVVGATHIAFCGKCRQGSFSDTPASTSCKNCPIGTSSNVVGANSSSFCLPCSAGFFSATEGAASCQPCLPSTFQPATSSTNCLPVGIGRFSPQNSSRFISCAPGFYCPNATGCADKCLYCGDVDGYSVAFESTSCLKCPHYYRPNQAATGCITSTTSLSASITDAITVSSILTESNEETVSPTILVSGNSSSESETEPTPTWTRHTPSRNFTRTASRSSSFGVTNTEQETESNFTSSMSESHSFGTRSETKAETVSRRTIFSVTPNMTETMNSSSFTPSLSERDPSQSRSSSQTNPTETVKVYPQKKKLGLSEEEQQQMQQTTSLTAALVGIVSAPTAMTMARSMAVLNLIGCPKREPSERVQFPFSLVPGLGIGIEEGFFHRGAALSFCVLFVLAFIFGFLNTETIGRPMDLSNEAEEEQEKEAEKKRQEEQEREKLEEESTSKNSRRTRGQSLFQRSKELGKELTSKIEKFATARQVPRVIYIIISATLGSFAAEAGYLFATLEPGDIAFAIIPLVLIFGFVIYMSIRVTRSANDREHGIYFTKSFVMMKSDQGKCKNLFISPPRAKSILNSPLGRFCFFGNYFWSRPKGKESIEAQKLLLSLGNQVQKFRGVVCRTNFIETANPFFDSDSSSSSSDDDDHEEQEQEEQTNENSNEHFGEKNVKNSSKSSDEFEHQNNNDDKKNHHHHHHHHRVPRERNKLLRAKSNEALKRTLITSASSTNSLLNKSATTAGNEATAKVSTKVFADWEEKEPPTIEVIEETNTLSAKLSLNYLLISWALGGSCAFLEGVALTRNETCSVIALVILAENIVSALIVLWLRPFVVPMRNVAACLLEISICVTSIIIAATLLTNEENRFDDPKLAKELDDQNAVASVVQMFNFIVGIVVSVIMAFSAVSRWILLNVGQCAAASHEEMWALRLMNDAEEELDRRQDSLDFFVGEEGIDAEEMKEYQAEMIRRRESLPFSIACLSTKAARTRCKKVEEEKRRMKDLQKKQEKNQPSLFGRLFSSLITTKRKQSNNNDDEDEDDQDENVDFTPKMVSPIQRYKDEELMESLLLPKDKKQPSNGTIMTRSPTITATTISPRAMKKQHESNEILMNQQDKSSPRIADQNTLQKISELPQTGDGKTIKKKKKKRVQRPKNTTTSTMANSNKIIKNDSTL